MSDFLHSTADFLVERSPAEWIGGVFAALVLALVLSGAYALFRRKMVDATMPLVALSLVVNLAAMVLAAGYAGMQEIGASGRTPAQREDTDVISPNSVADSIIEGMSMRILVGADADHNGLLSPDEAAAGAERFIKGIDAEGRGPVDYRSLGSALKRRIKPPGVHTGPPPGSPPGESARPR
jgi:hypothetical protein